MRVYIAGSSKPTERARAKRWHTSLRKLGVEVTSTWIESVEKHGAGNPREMSISEREACARSCIDGVRAADLLWLLVPPLEAPSRGAWFELGLMYEASSRALPSMICSGDTKQSIFCALGQECIDDAEAFVEVLYKAKHHDIANRPIGSQVAITDKTATIAQPRGAGGVVTVTAPPPNDAPLMGTDLAELIKAVREEVGVPGRMSIATLTRELRFRFARLRERAEIVDPSSERLQGGAVFDAALAEIHPDIAVATMIAAIGTDLYRDGWSLLAPAGEISWSAHLRDAPHVALRIELVTNWSSSSQPFKVEINDKLKGHKRQFQPYTTVGGFVAGWRRGLDAIR